MQPGSSTHTLLLKHALKRQTCTFSPQLNFLPRQPNLVAAAVVLSTIDAELVLLYMPFSGVLAAHGVAGERAVCRKDVGPMHLVGDFHPGDLGPDLGTTQFLELLLG